MLDSIKQWVLDLFSAMRKETDEKMEHLRLHLKRELYEEWAALAQSRVESIDKELGKKP